MTPRKIPKTIHAIWLKSILNDQGRTNLTNWKKVNKDYQVNLWIDSSLYGKDEWQHFEMLIAWANESQITICDVALNDKTSKWPCVPKATIYKNFINNSFYLDEANGLFSNLAAASDILRAEILFKEGGIYVDVKDVFAGNPLGDLDAQFEFYCHVDERLGINNDILASVKEGEIIDDYRKIIYQNYNALYANENKLRAHRNPQYRSPYLYTGQNPRKESTIEVSGPGALTCVLMNHHLLSKEKGKKIEFPSQYFTLPPRQENSWYDDNLSLEDTLIILRHFICEYFNKSINTVIENIKKEVEREKNKYFIFRDLHKLHKLNNNFFLFSKLQARLNGFPPTLSFVEIVECGANEFNSKEIKILNKLGGDIIDHLKRVSHSLENLIVYCRDKKIDPKICMNFFKSIAKYENYDVSMLKQFVNEILNTLNNQPETNQLEKYIHFKLNHCY